MNILQALDDPKVFGDFFRASTWVAWRVFLAALFGLPMTEDQLAIYRRFTGRSTPPTKALHEAWLVIGGAVASPSCLQSSRCSWRAFAIGVRSLGRARLAPS